MYDCPHCSEPIGSSQVRLSSTTNPVACSRCGGKSWLRVPPVFALTFVLGGVILIWLAWAQVVSGPLAAGLLFPVGALGYALHIVAARRFGRLNPVAGSSRVNLSDQA